MRLRRRRGLLGDRAVGAPGGRGPAARGRRRCCPLGGAPRGKHAAGWVHSGRWWAAPTPPAPIEPPQIL
eukprot:15294590-Alexandrium_andersonii.AAC.1